MTFVVVVVIVVVDSNARPLCDSRASYNLFGNENASWQPHHEDERSLSDESVDGVYSVLRDCLVAANCSSETFLLRRSRCPIAASSSRRAPKHNRRGSARRRGVVPAAVEHDDHLAVDIHAVPLCETPWQPGDVAFHF